MTPLLPTIIDWGPWSLDRRSPVACPKSQGMDLAWRGAHWRRRVNPRGGAIYAAIGGLILEIK